MINRGIRFGRLDQAALDQDRIGRRDEAVAPLAIGQHRRAPHVAGHDFLGLHFHTKERVVG